MKTPDLAPDHVLHGLLQKSSGLVTGHRLFSHDEIYWDANHYRLSQSSYFKSLTESQKTDILLDLNHKSLTLSHYIEKFGLNYGAKMTLEAESTEEKSLYALFSGDEVKHRLWLDQFLQKPVSHDIEFHPLLPSLALCLEKGNHAATVFTIQVVLEGFGLFHYAQLKESCQNSHLKEVFSNILKDETLHHGMGVAMMREFELDGETKEQITELTALFVESLLKADWVLKSLQDHTGDLTQTQIKSFKEETYYHEQLKTRVEKIRGLIHKVGFPELVQSLETKCVFNLNY